MINFDKVNAESKDILKAQPKAYKQLGRKPKPAEERKTERICIYLTKAQKEAIENKARLEYLQPSDYLLKRGLSD